MIRLVTFEADHLRQIRVQPSQCDSIAELLAGNPQYPEVLAQCHGRTALDADGRPLAIAGVAPTAHPRTGYAWAILSQELRLRDWGRVVVGMRVELDRLATRWPRIETHCDPLHEPSKRLLYHLGFRIEGFAREWISPGKVGLLLSRCPQSPPLPARVVSVVNLAATTLIAELRSQHQGGA